MMPLTRKFDRADSLAEADSEMDLTLPKVVNKIKLWAHTYFSISFADKGR